MISNAHGRRYLVNAILITADVIFLYLIFRLSFLLRQVLTPFFLREAVWSSTEPLMQMGILFCVAVFFIQGLYPGYGLTAVRELEKMGKAITLAFFLLAGVSFLVKPFQDYSRSILLIGWILSMVMLPLVHFIVRSFISRFSWYGVPVVVFGDGAWARQIVTSLRRIRRLGWYSTKLLPVKSIRRQDSAPLGEIAILALSPGTPADKYARLLNKSYRKVILFRQAENLGSLWIEPRDLEGQLGLEVHYHLFEGPSKWVKRSIDFGASLILLIALIPFWAILALLVYIDSPGPVFFYQERLGEGFKRFKVIKFRTMEMNAEQNLYELLKNDPAARLEYEKHHKLMRDPRVTRVGRWLRRYSLDELPQLWNALKGEMSLVGPRAYLPSELQKMGGYAATILRVKPGLTGWWQVAGRHNTTFHERLRMDEYYISNWSLWMDAYILFKTVLVIISGRGI
ncbi:MAG: exopolysaccharide biosynthesis polyprenyl glycosylphosphotransferase [Chloroflexi bacterium]|nr:exopolysaccharide biosynthesis polyprenyl glycosylphosphotransferase [Chloroflexota bacterium]